MMAAEKTDAQWSSPARSQRSTAELILLPGPHSATSHNINLTSCKSFGSKYIKNITATISLPLRLLITVYSIYYTTFPVTFPQIFINYHLQCCLCPPLLGLMLPNIPTSAIRNSSKTQYFDTASLYSKKHSIMVMYCH